MNDFSARSVEELITGSYSRAEGFSASVRHFGIDNPKVVANAEFGTPFAATYATTTDEVNEIRAWRDFRRPRRSNSVLLDSTTLATAQGLLTSTSGQPINALTLWDLARYVEAVVTYDTIHHFANPAVDDDAVNARLGEEVQKGAEWPQVGESFGGVPGLIYDAWATTQNALQALSEAAGTPTRAAQEMESLREGWSRALGRTITVADMLDNRHADHAFSSPCQRLIDQLAELVGGVSPLDVHSAAVMAHLHQPGRMHLTHVLTECNYRGQFNQRLANFLDLPYSPSIARIPFRQLHANLAREVDDRVRAIEMADSAYAERVNTPGAPRLRLELPVLLAIVLVRESGRAVVQSGPVARRRHSLPCPTR